MHVCNARRFTKAFSAKSVILMALCCIVGSVSTAMAQGQSSDPLQGRVLQNSDGTLFIYKDGQRYLLQAAPVGDDLINSIPIAGSADRLDQLFGQSSDTSQATPPTSKPTDELWDCSVPSQCIYNGDKPIGDANCWTTTATPGSCPSDFRVIYIAKGREPVERYPQLDFTFSGIVDPESVHVMSNAGVPLRVRFTHFGQGPESEPNTAIVTVPTRTWSEGDACKDGLRLTLAAGSRSIPGSTWQATGSLDRAVTAHLYVCVMGGDPFD